MTILVTGASGFLGARLVERLHEMNLEVRTFGRGKTQSARLARLEIPHLQGDVTDSEAVARAVAGCEMVFHLAGLVSYRRSDYQALYATNVVGARTVMEVCLRAGVQRVIHMGSIAGMGIPKEGTTGDESIEYNLKGLGLYYCDTKYEGEFEVMRLARQGLPVLCLNPGITFGEGDTHPHHHTIFKSMAGGWMLGFPTGGVMFSDIEDVVTTCINAMSRGRPGQRYVVGSANLTFREAAGCLARVLCGRAPVFPIPGPLAESAGIACEWLAPRLGRQPSLTWQVAWLSQRKIFFSSQKAIDELGHRQTPFEQTLVRTAPYYLGRRNTGTGAPEDSCKAEPVKHR